MRHTLFPSTGNPQNLPGVGTNSFVHPERPDAEACSDERHGAGARSDPPAASHEEGSTYMIMTQALGWALVDSLWQDALAAAGLAALLALIPVGAARIRYALATLTLGLMLALPLASAVRLSGTSPWTDDVVTATSPVAPGPTSGPGPQAAPMGAT